MNDDDYSHKSIGLYEFGNLSDDPDENYVYEGNNNYGNSSHKTGKNVYPFFLFYGGTSIAYEPTQFSYNSSTGNYIGTFQIDLPVNSDFTIGISFSTVYHEYESVAFTYYDYYVSNSEIIESDNLHIKR